MTPRSDNSDLGPEADGDADVPLPEAFPAPAPAPVPVRASSEDDAEGDFSGANDDSDAFDEAEDAGWVQTLVASLSRPDAGVGDDEALALLTEDVGTLAHGKY
jgi:hypothetical protein